MPHLEREHPFTGQGDYRMDIGTSAEPEVLPTSGELPNSPPKVINESPAIPSPVIEEKDIPFYDLLDGDRKTRQVSFGRYAIQIAALTDEVRETYTDSSLNTEQMALTPPKSRVVDGVSKSSIDASSIWLGNRRSYRLPVSCRPQHPRSSRRARQSRRQS